MDAGFAEAVEGLRRGDFSALEPLFRGRGPDEPAAILRWFREGRFGAVPDALEEAFTCACFNGVSEVVQALLAEGIGPAGGQATGLNAVHWAVNRGQTAVVRLLLDASAPLEVRNSYGGTALGTAVWSAIHEPRPAHLEIIAMLLRAGARRDAVMIPTGDERVDALLAAS